MDLDFQIFHLVNEFVQHIDFDIGGSSMLVESARTMALLVVESSSLEYSQAPGRLALALLGHFS
jgi:hypothetical protein